MLMNEYCAKCLTDKWLGRCPESADAAQAEEYKRRVRQIVLEAPEQSSPVKDYLLIQNYEAAFGEKVDYAPIKRHFNALLMEMWPGMAAEADAAPDPLRRAVQYAMVGNFIDFSAMKSVDESKLLQLLRDSEAMPIDETALQALRREVMSARTLLYLVDNCGEIVMDKVLMRTMGRLNPNLQITAMVHGLPIVNDATREDAEQVHLHEVARVMDNGCGIAGFPMELVSAEALKALEAADVSIAKGQANYETLCGCGRNLFYIFMCKCQLFMDRFGVRQYSGILTSEQ